MSNDQIKQLEHERNLLGQALGECIEAAGITAPDAPLTGPQLLMFAEDLKHLLASCATCNGSKVVSTTDTDHNGDHIEMPCPKCGGSGEADSGGIYPNGQPAMIPCDCSTEQLTAADYEEVLADHRRLVRELDVLLNGEEGAAQQASLCDLVAQVRTLRQVHDESVPVDNLGQSLLMLEFALMFALCNFQHAGSRNDVKKAQTRLQEVLRFLSGKAKGFHLNTTELGYCAENPDVLRALAYEHDARAAAAEAIELQGATSTHETRAAELRAEAQRIEEEL